MIKTVSQETKQKSTRRFSASLTSADIRPLIMERLADGLPHEVRALREHVADIAAQDPEDPYFINTVAWALVELQGVGKRGERATGGIPQIEKVETGKYKKL